jgi:hypothetical protein
MAWWGPLGSGLPCLSLTRNAFAPKRLRPRSPHAFERLGIPTFDVFR